MDSLLGEGGFAVRLLSPDPNEVWMRAVIMTLLVLFGLYAARAVRRHARAEDEIRSLNEDLEGRVAERTRLLRESEGRFRATFEQAAVGVAQISTDGGWMRVNARLCEILGYAEEELRKKTILEITHPDDLAMNVRQTGRLLAGQIPTYSTEKRYLKKDGSVVWAHLTVSVVRGASGEPDYLISVVEDISERKLMEEALFGAREAERSRIARDLHDRVLQDLSYAATRVDIARANGAAGAGSKVEANGDLGEAAGALRRSVRGLREAIYDIHPPRGNEASFVGALGGLLEASRRMAPELEISMTTRGDVPEELGGEKERQILRIVQEALTNARKHSGARRVSVTLGADETGTEIEIADDGAGFDPTMPRGGLGLTSMRERASAVRAGLEISSAPGEGTRVTVRIPPDA